MSNHMQELLDYAAAGDTVSEWAVEHIATIARQLADERLAHKLTKQDYDRILQRVEKLIDSIDIDAELDGDLLIDDLCDILAGLE